jgi:hypothetical protein
LWSVRLDLHQNRSGDILLHGMPNLLLLTAGMRELFLNATELLGFIPNSLLRMSCFRFMQTHTQVCIILFKLGVLPLQRILNFMQLSNLSIVGNPLCLQTLAMTALDSELLLVLGPFDLELLFQAYHFSVGSAL